MRRRLLIATVASVCLGACAVRWMTPEQVASATKACEDAGWDALLKTHPGGQQYVICIGEDKTP